MRCSLHVTEPDSAAMSNRIRTCRNVAVLATLSLLPMMAAAQEVSATGDYLQRMDVDGDGKVSLVEYQDWLSYAFDGMDLNHDGVLAPEEQPGGRGKPLARDEYRARLADRFRRQDLNHNDYLDTRELSAPPQGK
jgi:hypothetical protein